MSKSVATVFANDRPRSCDDDLYQWAVDAEEMIRRLDAENKTLKGELALWQNPNRSVIREMAALVAENKRLAAALAERDAEIEALKFDIHRRNQATEVLNLCNLRQAEMLTERDAEIERLETMYNRFVDSTNEVRFKVAAQREVLKQAEEALKAQPIETLVVWKDGIDLDVPVAHSKLCKAAITAIQEALS